jgi:hypothetical protein
VKPGHVGWTSQFLTPRGIAGFAGCEHQMQRSYAQDQKQNPKIRFIIKPTSNSEHRDFAQISDSVGSCPG